MRAAATRIGRTESRRARRLFQTPATGQAGAPRKRTGAIKYHLPSLNALRAFEAAARHLSFTKAADELCVTQGAISRHISILEDALGVSLFIRVPRHVELTPAAETYLRAIQEAFGKIDAATRILTEPGDIEQVSVLSLPTFASRWLLPRLNRFNELHPQYSIRLATTDNLADADPGDADVVIYGGPMKGGTFHSEKLLEVDMVPICNPLTVNGLQPPSQIEQLGNYTLLHVLAMPELWKWWADDVGVGNIDEFPASHFATVGLVSQAAQEGLGVGIGPSALIRDELAAGTLVIPFAGSVLYTYHLNVLETKLQRPAVASFRDWILHEARHDGA